jgi:hypothetical protein
MVRQAHHDEMMSRGVIPSLSRDAKNRLRKGALTDPAKPFHNPFFPRDFIWQQAFKVLGW